MIIQKFQEQVEKTPNKLAVKCIDGGYTYVLLDKYSSKIAYQLISTINNQDSVPVIGLLFGHGVDMILSILGVLKAGFIYVPLSPKYPKKRLQYMLEHSGASVILTNSTNAKLAETLFEDTNKIINIEDKTSYNNEVINRVNDEAYIMYTSGSTGKPKGVVQTQKNIYYFCENWANLFNIDSSDHLTLFSSFLHDASVTDIFTSLLFGATLYPYDVMKRDDSLNFEEFLLKEDITVWHSVPSLYSYFLNTLMEPVNNSSLKYILLGGEAIRKYEIDSSSKFFKDVSLVSIYGQTESSLNSACILNGKNKVTLGKILPETKIFLVDENNELVEPLLTGEIIIASNYISVGYWNVENNDNSPFIDSITTGRIYKTGDIGRLLVNGDIEILGRKDNQIKIRGFRIELGEIENVLLNNENVKESVVLAREEKEEMVICAYVVLWQKQKQEDLQNYLTGLLPDYMIPSYFIELKRLPLMANGKVNRKLLPSPEVNAGDDYVAPSGLVEIQLANIWSSVLGVPESEISAIASFFSLGGHSLSILQIINKIKDNLKINFRIDEFHRNPTIKGIAQNVIVNQSKNINNKISRALDKEYYATSSAQKRLYIQYEINPDGISYNTPKILLLKGDINEEKLKDTFEYIVNKHESFRTSFSIIDNELVQKIHKKINFKIEKIESANNDYNSSLKKFIKAFDLSKAPLIRIGVLQKDQDECFLIIDAHHIISDGTSLKKLVKDFTEYYDTGEKHEADLRYVDYSEWQNEYRKTQNYQKQQDYWLNKFKIIPKPLNILLDFKRPQLRNISEGKKILFSINNDLTGKIKSFTTGNNLTLFSFLFTCYKILLFKYTGQEDIVVGIPTNGRTKLEIEDIIGFFVNLLPIRTNPHRKLKFIDYLIKINKNLLEAYENQEFQFDDLIEKLQKKSKSLLAPMFNTEFAMGNFDIPEIQLKDLKVAGYDYMLDFAKFDLHFVAVDMGESIEFILRYSNELYKAETIELLVQNYQDIVVQVITEHEKYLEDISITTKELKINNELEIEKEQASDFIF